MLDLLAATAVATALAGVLLAVGLGLTVLPFVRAVDAAERRGSSPAGAGAAALVASAAGLLLAVAVLRTDLPTPWALLPLALCWVVPGLLVGGLRLGSRGAHE